MQHWGPARQEPLDPWRFVRRRPLSPSNDRTSAMHQQPPDIAVSSLADAPQSFLAAARPLLRHEAKPGRELSTGFELLGISNGRDDRVIGPRLGTLCKRRLVSSARCQTKSFTSTPLTCSATQRSCAAKTPSISAASAGSRRSPAVSRRPSSLSILRMPCPTTMPNSAKCARMALIRLLRRGAPRLRLRCSVHAPHASRPRKTSD